MQTMMGPDTACNSLTAKFDANSGKVIERPKRITNWTGLWGNEPSVTADGKQVAFLQSSSRGESYLADLGSEGTLVLESRRFPMEQRTQEWIVGWADGKNALVALNGTNGPSLRLQALNSDAEAPIVRSQPGNPLAGASLSPDGKWVIMQVWGHQEIRLMRVPLAGGVPEFMLSIRDDDSVSCARHPSTLCVIAEYSEDRKTMIVTAFDPVKGRGAELARIALNPDRKVGLFRDVHLICDLSPDGTRLALARSSYGPIEIHSLGGQPVQIIATKKLDKLQFIKWAAEGNGLFVSNVTNGGSEIIHVDMRGKTNRLWKCNTDDCFPSPSPDGRHLGIYSRTITANMWMMENF